MKLGPQTQFGAKSQSEGTIQLVPKSRKMAIIIPRRRGGTWEGVHVATWCSEWICEMRGGLVHHTIIIPAVLSLPLLRGACIRSCTDNISKWPVLYQNLQFFPVFHFFDCQKTQVVAVKSNFIFLVMSLMERNPPPGGLLFLLCSFVKSHV